MENISTKTAVKQKFFCGKKKYLNLFYLYSWLTLNYLLKEVSYYYFTILVFIQNNAKNRTILKYILLHYVSVLYIASVYPNNADKTKQQFIITKMFLYKSLCFCPLFYFLRENKHNRILLYLAQNILYIVWEGICFNQNVIE